MLISAYVAGGGKFDGFISDDVLLGCGIIITAKNYWD